MILLRFGGQRTRFRIVSDPPGLNALQLTIKTRVIDLFQLVSQTLPQMNLN